MFLLILTVTNPSLEDLGSICSRVLNGVREPIGTLSQKASETAFVPLRVAGVRHFGAENAIRRADLVR